jgi:hypothetical protein
MGVDLSGKHGSQSYNWWAWRDLLEMARSNGWKPVGTTTADDPDWNGDYFSNDGQRVTDDDAHAIADALSVAVRDAFEPSSIAGDSSGQSAANPSQSNPPAGMPFRAALDFLLFCREGGFTIR